MGRQYTRQLGASKVWAGKLEAVGEGKIFEEISEIAVVSFIFIVPYVLSLQLPWQCNRKYFFLHHLIFDMQRPR